MLIHQAELLHRTLINYRAANNEYFINHHCAHYDINNSINGYIYIIIYIDLVRLAHFWSYLLSRCLLSLRTKGNLICGAQRAKN